MCTDLYTNRPTNIDSIIYKILYSFGNKDVICQSVDSEVQIADISRYGAATVLFESYEWTPVIGGVLQFVRQPPPRQSTQTVVE